MGRRYTFYRDVDRSSREDFYEQQTFQRGWISCLVFQKVVESPWILVTERRAITSPSDKLSISTLCFAYGTQHVVSRHFYYCRLVRPLTLLQPSVSSTLRKTRREVVASCESNLVSPKFYLASTLKAC